MAEKATYEELEKELSELRKSYEQFRMMADSTQAYLAYINADDLVYRFVNRSFEKSFSCSRDEIIGKHIKEIIGQSNYDFALKYLEEVRSGRPSSYENTFNLAQGKRWLKVNYFPDFDEQGKVKGIAVLAYDITRQKLNDESLKNALKATEDEKSKSEAIIDAMGEAVSIQDTDFKILFQNKAHRNLIGDHVGEYCYQAYEHKDSICEGCPIAKSFKDGKAHVAQRSAETGQGLMHVEITASPLKAKNGKIIAGIEVVEDISRRLQTEQEARKEQNLESLGILAGGIAHDFNNMLMGIMGNISMAKMHAEADGKINRFLSESEKACERATGLTQQLLTFARGGAPIKLLSSLEDLIRDSVSFVLSGSRVKAEFIFEGRLAAAEVDPGQISQVFQNIVKNARQSMPEGGTVNVHARNSQVRKNIYGLQPGQYVRIDITDSGTGIPGDHLQRVFDPYFSTKQNGSGLGLTVAYSIVQGHQGRISVSSEPGVGSCFSVWLPASARTMAKTETADKSIPRGKGKILLMDDDESVRSVAVNMLARLGYETDTAEEGHAAIALYRSALKGGQPFAVVITDLTVPGGMGGEKTVKEILKIDPAAKVVVASGYANDPIMADFKKYGFSGVMPKPYRMEDLARLLHELIQGDKE